MRTVPQPIRTLAGISVAMLLIAGCTEPEIPLTDTATTDTTGEQPEEFDPLGDALSDAINQLTATLTQIQTVLNEPAQSRDLLHEHADLALDLLLFADTPVFPKARPNTERDATGDDLFSAILTAARQHGGLRGDMVTSAVRDTLAGDLGAWERDPDGMRATALTTFGATIPATNDLVATLNGNGMRAVAWIAFARTQQSPDVIREAFANATVHLEIVMLSLTAANL